MKWKISFIIVFLFLSVIGQLSYAGPIKFGVNTGVTKYTGSEKEFWNSGFNLGMHAFYPFTENILGGLRLGYSRIGIDDQELKDYYENYRVNWDVEGSTSVYEMMILFRFTDPYTKSETKFWFLQVGLGGLWLDSEYELKAPSGKLVQVKEPAKLDLQNKTVTINQKSPFDQELGGGLSIGFGLNYELSQSLSFELLPAYNAFLTREELDEDKPQIQGYLSLTLGVSF